MKKFTLLLQDAAHTEHINDVISFVGEDASGNFGILAGHARLMTSLLFGLARFHIEDMPWQYLALPGAVLYFRDNELSISTRRYLIDDNYERISSALQEQFVTEETELHAMKKSLHQMEEQLLKRLWETTRKGELAE
ncbi:MAG: F0F1 ATP synthase subunit epsilon [gamma proteobacterium endosymbiont of Lamellibrachia anaximandri]|nr:F0F1 ATP synthase subunit epsilon [gamma proteobacterium endosymbiont of Lamellibrachia anaximandri]MBL3535190.1 F0F1 ATP synthase subunit epsilon [gamma proteobacterium endosymbiont of Lamellibrachia anaximandri]